MSTNNFSADPFNFSPETYIFPEEFNDDFRLKLRQYLNDLALALNVKENGFHIEEETPTGQNFIPLFSTDTSQNISYRPVYRTVIDTGALPNSATSSTAHGIATDENYSIVHLYGAATDPGASTITAGIPLPHINVSAPADSVQLDIDATNINITTTTGNYTAYTRSFVCIEYIKEV